MSQRPKQPYHFFLPGLSRVPVKVQPGYLWFLLFLLVLFKSATGYYSITFLGWNSAAGWSVAYLLTLLIGFSILIHEVAHTVVAMRLGITVKGITLSVFGGVSEITDEAEEASTELRIALAGPLASLLLGLVFGLGWLAAGTGWPGEQGRGFKLVLLLASTANLGMGAFNLLPGLPLDGGRALRAFFWKRTGNFDRATAMVENTGAGLGALLFMAGWYYLFQNLVYFGSAISFSGLFIATSALLGGRATRWRGRLRGYRADQLMQQDLATAEAVLPLAQLIQHHLLVKGYVLLMDGPRTVGVLDLNDVKKVSSELWWHVPGRIAMTPFEQMPKLSYDATVLQVSNLMEHHKTRRVFIMGEGRDRVPEVVGVLAQEQIHRVARRTRYKQRGIWT